MPYEGICRRRRHSGCILTLCPSPSKGEGKKECLFVVRIPTPAEPGEACLTVRRDLLNNGNVILSTAKNLLNSVHIVGEIPACRQAGLATLRIGTCDKGRHSECILTLCPSPSKGEGMKVLFGRSLPTGRQASTGSGFGRLITG